MNPMTAQRASTMKNRGSDRGFCFSGLPAARAS